MGFGSGVVGDVVSGSVIGVGSQLATPWINAYVPSVMNMSPTTIALLGGGVLAKGVLHKGGKWASAAIIIGSAQAAQQLASGMGGSNAAGGMQFY